jgi:hypothetical protein
MTGNTVFALTFAAALGVAGPAGTDVWDSAVINDNGNGTLNVITHDFSQPHDLGVQPGPVADEDWFLIYQQPFSSYEILVDGVTGDAVSPILDMLVLVDSTGTGIQFSLPYSFAFARSLRFANDTSAAITDQFVRVANAGCGTNCDQSDQYRIRAWDTTISVPRYNNAGSQITVLFIQNPSEVTVSGFAYLWTTSGGTTPVIPVAFALSPRQAMVVNLATVGGGVANGTSGTITITHNARYGQLAVKAVALEPSTGFSFDSPGLYKP